MRWLSVLISAAIMSPAGALAGGSSVPAHVSTAGTVRTNSSLLPSGTTIYGGDVIATGEDGLAIVTSRGCGRLEVRPSSRVEFGANQVTLREGAVAADKSTVGLGEYTIQSRTPESADNWFAVASRSGRKVVAAHRGDVLIARAGMAPLLVPAGSYAVADDAEQTGESATSKPKPADAKAEDADCEEQDDDKKHKDEQDDDDKCAVAGIGKAAGKAAGGKAAETVANTDGWTIGSLDHKGSVILVTTIGAAAATGTALGFALSDDPVSPVQ
jgi:hypothetical protein